MDVAKLLDRFQRVSLTPLPTPLEYAENLTKHLGGPRIFIKRDDCTALAFGGNKTRKLEFIMADAIRKKSDVMITIGGLQSNWARQMASAARKFGMEVILVLEGKKPKELQGNLLLDHLMGCEIRYREFTQEEEDREIQGECPITGEIAKQLRNKDRRPYTAPLGAATPLGNLGYIKAVAELKDQLDAMGTEAHYIVFPTGTGGTHAGIELGTKLLGMNTRVLGISISRHTREKVDEISELCNKTMEFLELDDFRWNPQDIRVTYDYVGKGYAVPTEECIAAVRTVAVTEGIILCPVYTGKAMAGLIHMIREKRFRKEDNVVFIHTGGGTANFAFNKIYTETQDS